MARRGVEDSLLPTLEAAVGAIAVEHDQAVLAFSAGLRSLCVGAVLRKRMDLHCVVSGVRGAPDIRASALVRDYLDVSVDVALLAPARALSMAREAAVRFPGAAPADLLDLVPLLAVLEKNPRSAIVVAADAGNLPRVLRRMTGRMRLPLLDLPWNRPIQRAELRAIGRSLGLPVPFLRAEARSPARGSGVDGAMRSLARDRRTSMRSLLRP